MLWRACRGNVFLRQAEIEDPLEDPLLGAGDEVFKSVFVIFFQGEQLKTRVKKICEGFRATLYPCPDQVTLNNLTYLKRISRLRVENDSALFRLVYFNIFSYR